MAQIKHHMTQGLAGEVGERPSLDWNVKQETHNRSGPDQAIQTPKLCFFCESKIAEVEGIRTEQKTLPQG